MICKNHYIANFQKGGGLGGTLVPPKKVQSKTNYCYGEVLHSTLHNSFLRGKFPFDPSFETVGVLGGHAVPLDPLALFFD